MATALEFRNINRRQMARDMAPAGNRRCKIRQKLDVLLVGKSLAILKRTPRSLRGVLWGLSRDSKKKFACKTIPNGVIVTRIV